MYPLTGSTGKVAGTFAIPTVTPLFDRYDQIGSCFSMLVLAVIPPTMKPVTPCSSGFMLVNIVQYTRGQFGAETVCNFPYTPRSITLARLGSLFWRRRGRRMSHSIPLTPSSTTFVRGELAWLKIKTGA